MHGLTVAYSVQDIRDDIVYCYPSDNFYTIKNFNGAVIFRSLPGAGGFLLSLCRFQNIRITIIPHREMAVISRNQYKRITYKFHNGFDISIVSFRWQMNDLLNVISASEKRRNLLILLESGPQEWDAIRQKLHVTSTGMLPQIKILEEESLIRRENRTYSLTPLGKVLTCRMEPLVRALEVLDKNRKFWREHDLSVLPHEILMNIGDLGDYRIVETPDEDFFNVTPFLEKIAGAGTIKGIAHTVHPKYPEFFLSLAKKGAETSLILTPAVFRIIREHYREMLGEWLECPNAHLYVPGSEIRFSFVVTDLNVSLSLFFTSGIFDSTHDILSNEPSAREWGESIFAYYRKQSREIFSLD